MRKRYLLPIVMGVLIAISAAIFLLLNNNTAANHQNLHFTYEIVKVYPHDSTAFTQGLVFEDGFLYESTGLRGSSTLRRVELETGNIVQIRALSDTYFAEGIAIIGDKIVQLTWDSNVGFLYDKYSFDLISEFSYSTQGWGITYDGNRLIMSDGTANLYFLDPNSFEVVGQIEVHDESPVDNLNELEYIEGKIYANIWGQEKIVIISPENGQIEGWIDLTGIYDLKNNGANNVLNGIAYDSKENRLFVTGKRWSRLFEIKLIPIK
jgi:glutamine cyclotransferase